MRTALLASLLLGAVACAHPPAPDPAPTAAATREAPTAAAPAVEARPAVSLQLLLRGDEGVPVRALGHRETLPVGARVALWMGAERQPLWLYPYHRGPEGKLEPLGGPTQLAPGDTRELPGSGTWYRLEGAAGAESFYVVAAREPLSPERQRSVEAELPTEREPPPRSSTSTRFPGPLYRQSLDERGVAILAVGVLHAAAHPAPGS